MWLGSIQRAVHHAFGINILLFTASEAEITNTEILSVDWLLKCLPWLGLAGWEQGTQSGFYKWVTGTQPHRDSQDIHEQKSGPELGLDPDTLIQDAGI